MRISIFGLGYVGAVTAGCLAEAGHTVIGVDVHRQKVDQINEGRAPLVEPGIDELLRAGHSAGRLSATVDCDKAVEGSDVSLVCVGTPLEASGVLDMTHVREVTAQIAGALRRQGKRHRLIFRSTMLPGSTRGLVAEFLDDVVNKGEMEVCYYPEFLRESTAVADFRQPSLAVVGTMAGEPFAKDLKPLLGEAAQVVNWETAEMIKFACNAFHATKVTFANEMGRLAKQMGVDGQVVMKLLCGDTRLNLSSYYMKPGNPFGGSCLPKDVRALADHGRQQGLNLPLLENLLPSNQEHLQRLLQQIAAVGKREVIILGLAFKSHTDDLRGSAMVEVAQRLQAHNFAVRIYDPQLDPARMVGSNKRMIENKMPHLSSLLQRDLSKALGAGGVVVAAHRCAEVAELARWIKPTHHILDVNGWPELRGLPTSYEGFCW